MNHLKEGSAVWRAYTYWCESQNRWWYRIMKVVVCLQHPTLGTFYTYGGQHQSARHGELHETRESAVKFVIDLLNTARDKTAPCVLRQQIEELEQNRLKDGDLIG